MGSRRRAGYARQSRLDPAARGTRDLEIRVLLAGRGRHGVQARLRAAWLAAASLRGDRGTVPDRRGRALQLHPDLGIFHAVTGIHGDILIPEDRLRAALVRSQRGETELEAELARLLGKPWDDELEPFRYAGEGAPVRWLHQVV
ncbi:DUF3145 family protein [Streptomyces chiangmaiensis]